MKRFIVYASLFVTLFIPNRVFAAQNNRFGVHILFPEEVPIAAELVNSSGGDWGWVVIPIQAVDRNRDKWQRFMDDCAKYHLIPILRLATYPQGQNWMKPDEFGAVDFANFLSDLNWPTREKHVIVYNEPNHANEWGGEVNPQEYADVLSDTIFQFKKRNRDFVVLGAGLDAAAPDSSSTMDEYEFMLGMASEVPDIFQKIDGLNAHSYPNPAFSGSPYAAGRYGISSYISELDFMQNYFGVLNLPVYITETGWKKSGSVPPWLVSSNFEVAYQQIWKEDYIKVIAPFVLKADAGPFEPFSILDKGEKREVWQAIYNLKKEKGAPAQETKSRNQNYYKIDNRVAEPAQDAKTNLKFKNLWKNIINWVLKSDVFPSDNN